MLKVFRYNFIQKSMIFLCTFNDKSRWSIYIGLTIAQLSDTQNAIQISSHTHTHIKQICDCMNAKFLATLWKVISLATLWKVISRLVGRRFQLSLHYDWTCTSTTVRLLLVGWQIAFATNLNSARVITSTLKSSKAKLTPEMLQIICGRNYFFH